MRCPLTRRLLVDFVNDARMASHAIRLRSGRPPCHNPDQFHRKRAATEKMIITIWSSGGGGVCARSIGATTPKWSALLSFWIRTRTHPTRGTLRSTYALSAGTFSSLNLCSRRYAARERPGTNRTTYNDALPPCQQT